MAYEKLSGESLRVFNDTFIEMVKEGNEKQAAVDAQSYTRNKLREDSFTEKILTPIEIANSELDKAQDTEYLVKYVDREPSTAPAVTVPLGVTPDSFQFKGTRYPVLFSRIVSPMFNKDIDKLRSYDYDIRAIMLELSTKDIATEIDTRFISTVNSYLGTINTSNVANTGYALPSWISLAGGVTRENLAEATKTITRLKVPFGPLQPDGGSAKGVALANVQTATDLLKFGRGEAGGDASQAMLETGKPMPIFGVPFVITLKDDLIPDGTIYFFSSEEFLGKYFRLQNLTVFMESQAYFLRFFQYLFQGIAIGNTRGFTRVDFLG